MCLIECVAGEGLDKVEDRLRLRPAVALGQRTLDEPLLLGPHDGANLLPHRLAHHVCLAQRVAGEPLGDEQHLVLVHDHPIRLVQDFRQVRVRVPDRLLAVLRPDVSRYVLHRTGTVQGHHRRQVLDRRRPQLLHVAPHPARLQLEHPKRLPLGQHLVRLRLTVGQVREVHLHAAGLPDHLHRLAQDRQVRQPQEVHLQQPQLRYVVHGVLGRGQRVGVAGGGPL